MAGDPEPFLPHHAAFVQLLTALVPDSVPFDVPDLLDRWNSLPDLLDSGAAGPAIALLIQQTSEAITAFANVCLGDYNTAHRHLFSTCQQRAPRIAKLCSLLSSNSVLSDAAGTTFRTRIEQFRRSAKPPLDTEIETALSGLVKKFDRCLTASRLRPALAAAEQEIAEAQAEDEEEEEEEEAPGEVQGVPIYRPTRLTFEFPRTLRDLAIPPITPLGAVPAPPPPRPESSAVRRRFQRPG
jgi:hypothetical protein